MGMLRNEKLKRRGHEYLNEFINADEKEKKIFATNIIAEIKDIDFADDLVKLINDKDTEVSKSAIEAAGKLHDAKIITELLYQLEKGHLTNAVLGALVESGHAALVRIYDYLHKQPLDKSKRIQLINIFGKTGGAEAKKLLDEMIAHHEDCLPEIIYSLYLADFKVNEHQQKRYSDFLQRLLDTAINIVLQISILEITGKHDLLIRALQLELNSYRTVILNVFTFFYDTEKIHRARNAFYLNKKESIANALEIIDVTVTKESAQKFIAIYDTTDTNHKSMTVKKYSTKQPTSLHDVMSAILDDTTSTYNDWTKACALYELKNEGAKKYHHAIAALAANKNLLVSETANYVLEN